MIGGEDKTNLNVLKKRWKGTPIWVLILVTVLLAGNVALGAYLIYSNITGPMQAGGYTLTLWQPIYSNNGDGTLFFNISGTLRHNGVGVVGATIEIYTNATVSESGTLTKYVGSTITFPEKSNGFEYYYVVSDGNWYRFQARYQVP
jgi:hypothetical protein